MVSLYRQGKMTGGLFRCLGQEATAVGSAFALEEGDLLIPVIRDLGATLVRGARPVDILRQVMTKGDAPGAGPRRVPPLLPAGEGALLGDRDARDGRFGPRRDGPRRPVPREEDGRDDLSRRGRDLDGRVPRGDQLRLGAEAAARRRPRVQPLLLLDAVGDAVRRRHARRQGRRLRRRERDRRRERRPRRRRGGPAGRGLGARREAARSSSSARRTAGRGTPSTTGRPTSTRRSWPSGRGATRSPGSSGTSTRAA